MIKAVFIDIDDTLLSFSGYVKESMKKGFEKYGLKSYTEDMYPVFRRINDSLWQSLERGEITFEELKAQRWKRIFGALGIDFDGAVFEEYFRACLFVSAIPVDGAEDFLEYLSGRYPLIAASNGPYDQQINRLNLAGMSHFFREIFISSRTGAPKPDKGFFDYCFRYLREHGFPDLLPEETIQIGDSLTSDIAGAASYGMHTCLYQEKETLLTGDIRPDFVIHRLSEIRSIL